MLSVHNTMISSNTIEFVEEQKRDQETDEEYKQDGRHIHIIGSFLLKVYLSYYRSPNSLDESLPVMCERAVHVRKCIFSHSVHHVDSTRKFHIMYFN